MKYWVYIMASPGGTLYIGSTSELVKRAWQHKSGAFEGFTKQYALKRLVYFERHEEIGSAIQREQNMKHWSRAWKVNRILAANPYWGDPYDRLA